MRCVIGDPQAPFDRVMAVLDRHALLARDGSRLRDDVELVSVGDHFDWYTAGDPAGEEADGSRFLRWLAAHSERQVTILAGNHDLGRVGELARFDDARFAVARKDAESVTEADEDAFLARWPELPSSELVRRDFSGFRVAQRELVEELLANGRMRLAFAAADDLLVCHAGVTTAHVGGERSAVAIAQAMNARFDEAVRARRKGEPLVVPGLHAPGDGTFGEGDGVLYHRPAYDTRGRRRYDPRELPRGLTQVVGHTRDAKCRELLAPWTDPEEPPGDGPLRHLVVRADGSVHYARGVHARAEGEAVVVFADGALLFADLDDYEMLDLDTRAPLKDRKTTTTLASKNGAQK